MDGATSYLPKDYLALTNSGGTYPTYTVTLDSNSLSDPTLTAYSLTVKATMRNFSSISVSAGFTVTLADCTLTALTASTFADDSYAIRSAEDSFVFTEFT